MSLESLGLSPHLQEYLLSITLREDDILRELRDLTAQRKDSNMQIAPEQGQLMSLLVKLTGARQVLEIGTFTGYSALVMAQALPDEGKVVTLDINPETAEIARRYWKKAGVDHKIVQHLGPAQDTLQKLEGPFDLAFIDADKSNYDFYYEQSLGLLRAGGLILLDNVLWGGDVADPSITDEDTEALRSINRKIHSDDRVDMTVVPIADGLTLARKR